jgi:hypothetical protein
LTTFAHIDEIGGWNELVTACGAPVFYRSEFLRAFERMPLHGVSKWCYLVGVGVDDGLGPPRFGLPVWVQRGVDPMRMLADHFPAMAGETMVLSHVWHCYDTHLPAHALDIATVRAVLDALRRVADEAGAAGFGFVNVSADGALARALDGIGVRGVDVDRRFTADLSGFACLDDYINTLGHKERNNLRRYLRRARDADVRVTFGDPTDGDLDEFVALARANAAKYDNAGYYQPGLFQDFVRALGPAARLLEMRYRGKLAGAFIALLDDHRFHVWAGGHDYAAIPRVSPFYLGFTHLLREAIDADFPVLEAGRRNEPFKTRYGMRPRTVRAYLLGTGEPA